MFYDEFSKLKCLLWFVVQTNKKHRTPGRSALLVIRRVHRTCADAVMFVFIPNTKNTGHQEGALPVHLPFVHLPFQVVVISPLGINGCVFDKFAFIYISALLVVGVVGTIFS